MKRIINIFIGFQDRSLIYKDPGMIVYSMSRYCGWEGTHAFLNEMFHHGEFEQYGNLLSMGEVKKTDRKSCIKEVRNFIKNQIRNYDVVFLFNYGSTNYKMAYLCKNIILV